MAVHACTVHYLINKCRKRKSTRDKKLAEMFGLWLVVELPILRLSISSRLCVTFSLGFVVIGRSDSNVAIMKLKRLVDCVTNAPNTIFNKLVQQ